jgi:predicted nucleotidyltransferase component of viral defense system
MINPESVKSRLKNKAKDNGRLFQDVLITYCLERTIYRLSVSEYNSFFTLKGGIFLYALFEGDFSRATSDIDLLGKNIESSVDRMKEIFNEIFAIETDDAIVFDLETMHVKSITEFKEYTGVNISVIARLDKTKVPVSIDVGFGDIVYPERVLMEFPTLLEMEKAKIYSYSVETVVAEKLEAVVSLGYVNSRYKDFYDIYILCKEYDFDSRNLVSAIRVTFEHRKTELNDIVAFNSDFINDMTRQKRWNSFIKKKRAMEQVDFPALMALIKSFLLPIITCIKNNDLYEGVWDSKSLKWLK